MPGAALLTVGHGTMSQEDLTELLQAAGVGTLVDVRRFPGSRRHPHVARDAMEGWVPSVGISYLWMPALGGRRRLPGSDVESVDTWWRVEAFRAYAAYARSEEFHDALDDVLGRAAASRVAVMCSEAVWWRCHRRIISDVAVLLHDVPVLHLAHSGKLTPHPPAAGARVTDEGLVYDRADPERAE